MRFACARRKYQHMQALIYKPQCLKSLFAIKATQILHDQRASPFEFSCLFERNSPSSEIEFALGRVKADVHVISVYTYIR